MVSDWCLIVRTWGDTPATLIVCPTLGRRHQHVAQCCRNIQSSFSKCLGIQKVCLSFKLFHKNVDKKYFFKSKNSEKNKIMIWGIHYFITKLKTKIDVIPRSCWLLPTLSCISYHIGSVYGLDKSLYRSFIHSFHPFIQQFIYLHVLNENEINGVLSHLCAYIG